MHQMTLNEVDTKLMRIAHERVVSAGVYPSCLNCEHWDKGKGQCSKWGQTPPPEVIVYSCEHYESYIPF